MLKFPATFNSEYYRNKDIEKRRQAIKNAEDTKKLSDARLQVENSIHRDLTNKDRREAFFNINTLEGDLHLTLMTEIMERFPGQVQKRVNTNGYTAYQKCDSPSTCKGFCDDYKIVLSNQ